MEEMTRGVVFGDSGECSEGVEFARLELVPSSAGRSVSAKSEGISMSLSFPNGVSSKVEGLDSDTSALLLMELVSRCAPSSSVSDDTVRL